LKKQKRNIPKSEGVGESAMQLTHAHKNISKPKIPTDHVGRDTRKTAR